MKCPEEMLIQSLLARGMTRRRVLQVGAYGIVAATGAGAAARWFSGWFGSDEESGVFKDGAPRGKTWELWKKRGWVKKAYHFLKLGRNVQCKLCPNNCLLSPQDRGRCRNRVNKDGTLYTMVYSNPCTFHVDPIEKKPLFHFHPGSRVFSIATSGCGFRCLNCQNWSISQKRPEETKDPRGEPLRLTPEHRGPLTRRDVRRLSMFPEDVVAQARRFGCPSIAYTYSEPTCFYEYMLDTSKLARERKIKNVWVTCGYIMEKPLRELCRYLNAANVDLKSFSPDVYRKLNSGKLQPILDTLKILRDEGVWFEVTNLLVPTYTDNFDMIRRMCDWLVENLGPDYPLHFSRFRPAHKLAHLPPTPAATLVKAKKIALDSGLHYVYIGNARGIPDAETTFCPHCKKAVIERTIFTVRRMNIQNARCRFCQTPIAGRF